MGPVSKSECTNEASMLRVSLGDWARMLLGNSARTLCPNIAKEGRDNFRCVEYSNGEGVPAAQLGVVLGDADRLPVWFDSPLVHR